MSHTPRTIYFVMAAYLIVGGAIRCYLFVATGQRPDWLPIVAIVLGAGALIAAFRPHPAVRRE